VSAGARKRWRKPITEVRHWLEYVIIRALYLAFIALPLPVSRRVGAFLGDVIRIFDSRRRRTVASGNLKQAFPDLGDVQIDEIVRKVYRNLMISVVDSVKFLRHVMAGTHMELVDVVGFERLARSPLQTGVIFVTAHFGCWEVLGAVLTSVGYPASAIARPLGNPYLNTFLEKLRRVSFGAVLRKRGAMRQVLKMVASGANVGFLIDQDARREGIFVDFFGRPASTVTSVARLSLYTGAPVAFIYALPSEDRLHFTVELKDLIWPRRDAPRDEEITRITQRFTGDVAELVRENPDQWLWLHERWKTYPGKYSR